MRKDIHVAKTIPYILRILKHPRSLLTFESHFNIILPSTVASFKIFDFHLVFILKFLRYSYLYILHVPRNLVSFI